MLLPLETFTLVWSVVLLCLLLPHPACIRYKVRPAWLVGGDSGRKFAMHGQNAPNWAILGEQGEFCLAHAVRMCVLGEFCTGSGVVRLVLGEFCTAVARHGSCWASFVPPWRRPCVQVSSFRRPRAPRPYPRVLQPGPPSRSGARCAGCGGGFAALEAGWLRVAGVS